MVKLGGNEKHKKDVKTHKFYEIRGINYFYRLLLGIGVDSGGSPATRPTIIKMGQNPFPIIGGEFFVFV